MQQICHINFFIPEIILIIFELFDWEFSTVLFSMFFFFCVFFFGFSRLTCARGSLSPFSRTIGRDSFLGKNWWRGLGGSKREIE